MPRDAAYFRRRLEAGPTLVPPWVKECVEFCEDLDDLVEALASHRYRIDFEGSLPRLLWTDRNGQERTRDLRG